MSPNPQLSIEDTLTELEALVDTLEQMDLPLDDSIKRFDRSLALARASSGDTNSEQGEPLAGLFENYALDADPATGEHG